jgi:hypothetical protein
MSLQKLGYDDAGSPFERGHTRLQVPDGSTAPIELILEVPTTDRVSVQAIWSAGVLSVPVAVADGDDVDVDAGVATWTFAGGAFDAAHVGGTITVTGAAEPENNGTFEITAVNSATEIETDDGDLVDETFVAAGMTVTLEYEADGDITGTWSAACSNSYIPHPSDPSETPLRAGAWTTITARLVAAPTNPAGTAGSADIDFGWVSQSFVKVILTPSNGGGYVDLYASGKAYT